MAPEKAKAIPKNPQPKARIAEKGRMNIAARKREMMPFALMKATMGMPSRMAQKMNP